MIRPWARSTLLAACSGRAAAAPWLGEGARTGIDKRPLDGPVHVGELGLVGDEQADTANHGGRDQALYAYAQEDVDHWVEALARELPSGCFGENLRTTGLEVSTARIGERWRIGDDVEVEVTAPRIPCRVFAGFWDVPDLVQRFLSAGRPGAYLRVRATGEVSAGDRIEVVHQPNHDVTSADVLRIHTRDRHQAASLLEVDGLAERVREWARSQAGANG